MEKWEIKNWQRDQLDAQKVEGKRRQGRPRMQLEKVGEEQKKGVGEC